MDEKQLEMMRRRHNYFKKLIDDQGLPASGDFYLMYHDFFEIMGNEICYDNPLGGYGDAKIIVHLLDGNTEEYIVNSRFATGYAKVSPIVVCKRNGVSTEVDISQ